MEIEREITRERERKRERMKLRIEKEKKRVIDLKKNELKELIQDIQEDVQAKVTGQVVTILQTFLGDISLLLRHLLKGGLTSEQYHEKTMETARALQVLHQFDLRDSESDTDTDSYISTDSDLSASSEGGNTKGAERDRGLKPQFKNICQCGKVVRKYQQGIEFYHLKSDYLYVVRCYL